MSQTALGKTRERQTVLIVLALAGAASTARASDGAAMFAAMDTNRDGVVDEKELVTFASPLFDKMDNTHDGFLTIADFLRAPVASKPPPTAASRSTSSSLPARPGRPSPPGARSR